MTKEEIDQIVIRLQIDGAPSTYELKRALIDSYNKGLEDAEAKYFDQFKQEILGRD